MEDEQNDVTESEEPAGAAADPTEEPSKRPNRFLFGIGWTIGRGTRAVTNGAKWLGGSTSGAVVSAARGIGDGLHSIKPGKSSPALDEDLAGEEPTGEEAAEEGAARAGAAAEGEKQKIKKAKKTKKKE
jgi:hypothetical protein